MKYWLHRISHKAEVAYPLLDRGYLSTGWSDMAADKRTLSALERFAAAGDADEAWKSLELAHQELYGCLDRARYSIWRFLFEFRPGDCVLVPSGWGTFSLYKIASAPLTAASLKDEPLNFGGLTDWNKKPLTLREKGIYRGEEFIDLGFFRRLEPIAGARELSRYDYADAALTSRMKLRQTSADISDLAENIQNVIEAARTGAKPSVYGTVIEGMRDTLLDAIRKKLNPDKLEYLVAWYLRKCGAEPVTIPAKNASNKKDGADADVIATFETLKVILCVQVKHHEETTSEWAVEQVSKYKEQTEDAGGEYHYITWVVSTGDQFSEEAVKLAGSSGVRLIGGREFAGMLLDRGIQNIDEAF
ncbi:MAG: restriction endonuclease [Synergistaceae bacterium]|jgi:predicted Mrr-cat superfamily restriction endonuclease|nr:restriction endonuclease [Synergistaceae bacterium]